MLVKVCINIKNLKMLLHIRRSPKEIFNLIYTFWNFSSSPLFHQFFLNSLFGVKEKIMKRLGHFGFKRHYFKSIFDQLILDFFHRTWVQKTRIGSNTLQALTHFLFYFWLHPICFWSHFTLKALRRLKLR